MRKMEIISASLLCALLVILTSCGITPAVPATFTPMPLADELILYNWVDYVPQSVLDAFTKEFGVKFRYIIYESQEDAADNVAKGIEYDIAVLPPDALPRLIAAQRLAKLDYRNIPNFRNITANFRGLAYDPDNSYSIPYRWGTTGILVRTDLVNRPITRWSDLWDPAFSGKVAIWPIARSLIPLSLKSLGYKANSVKRDELEVALKHLIELKPRAILWGNENSSIVPALVSGQAVIAFGWAYDALSARQEKVPISYILPEEGTFMWGDNFVIPASSKNKYTAELFLNFILRPEISAMTVNEGYYPIANDAAKPYIKLEILNDPVIYPPENQLQRAEIIMPLSDAGENLFRDVWKRFLEAGN